MYDASSKVLPRAQLASEEVECQLIPSHSQTLHDNRAQVCCFSLNLSHSLHYNLESLRGALEISPYAVHVPQSLQNVSSGRNLLHAERVSFAGIAVEVHLGFLS
jgi:hypothetical protein